MRYFSERERGEGPRETEEIGDNVWWGILGVIRRRVQDESFGASFPDICQDGTFFCGTHKVMLDDALRAEIPELAALSEAEFRNRMPVLKALEIMEQPPTFCILDLIEFCWKYVGAPTAIGYHSFQKHSHLTFDVEAGRDNFREDIEQIFRRNGIAYTLSEEGIVERGTVLEGAVIEIESVNVKVGYQWLPQKDRDRRWRRSRPYRRSDRGGTYKLPHVIFRSLARGW